MTHSAIDNFHSRVNSLFELLEVGLAKGFLPFARLGEVIDQLKGGIVKIDDTLSKNRLKQLLKQDVTIVMGTCWKIFGNIPEGSFDLVIIDEASQLLTADASIPIRALAKGGRLLLGGDHMQLKPILNTVYPALPPKEPNLFSSVLDCARRNEKNESDISPFEASAHTVIIQENFRMVKSV